MLLTSLFRGYTVRKMCTASSPVRDTWNRMALFCISSVYLGPQFNKQEGSVFLFVQKPWTLLLVVVANFCNRCKSNIDIAVHDLLQNIISLNASSTTPLYAAVLTGAEYVRNAWKPCCKSFCKKSNCFGKEWVLSELSTEVSFVSFAWCLYAWQQSLPAGRRIWGQHMCFHAERFCCMVHAMATNSTASCRTAV